MTVDNDTIPTDVSKFEDDDTGANAFLSSFRDEEPKKKVPPSEEEIKAPETDEETVETEEKTEETEPESDDPDEQEIDIKVGEETLKAKLKDLKRLYGQEASLTQKSQHASEQLKLAEAQALRATTATKALLDRAQVAFEPYRVLDMAAWALLAKDMSPENYNQLRQDAATAQASVTFLTTELDGYMREQQQKTQTEQQAAATAAIAELSHAETGVKGWSKELYNDLTTYADTQGLPEFRGVVNAKAIRLMHKAMLYDRAQEAAKAAATKVKVAVDKSKNVLRPGASKENSGQSKLTDALKILRRTGDPEDAAAAFQASF